MAYVAPNEDTVVVVGGLGTQADKNTANGGGATKTVWDAGSPSDFMGANGAPVTANANAAFDYGDKTIAAVGIGTGVTVGTLCYCDDGAAEASFFTGIYKVTTVAANLLTFANIELSGVDTDQANGVTCNVGGAIDGLQNALDKPVNNAASYNRYIYDNIASETTAAQIDIDVNSGSATTRIYVLGYNSTLTAKAEIIITTTSDIAALIMFDGAQTFYIFKNIDFDGGGKDASRASYCVSDVVTASHYVTFEDCKFHGAESHGVEMDSDYWVFIRCEAYLNGGSGILTGSQDGVHNRYVGCSFHDNDSHGLSQNGSLPAIIGCFAYDNGKDGVGDGFYISSITSSVVTNNTAYGNADDGFVITAATDYAAVFNNTSVGNGGYGYDLSSELDLLFFGYNHAYGNTGNAGDTTHCTEIVDASFANFLDGNNQTGDPLFTNVGDGVEDFTPTAGSPLIDNALDAGTA